MIFFLKHEGWRTGAIFCEFCLGGTGMMRNHFECHASPVVRAGMTLFFTKLCKGGQEDDFLLKTWRWADGGNILSILSEGVWDDAKPF